MSEVEAPVSDPTAAEASAAPEAGDAPPDAGVAAPALAYDAAQGDKPVAEAEKPAEKRRSRWGSKAAAEPESSAVVPADGARKRSRWARRTDVQVTRCRNSPVNCRVVPTAGSRRKKARRTGAFHRRSDCYLPNTPHQSRSQAPCRCRLRSAGEMLRGAHSNAEMGVKQRRESRASFHWTRQWSNQWLASENPRSTSKLRFKCRNCEGQQQQRTRTQ